MGYDIALDELYATGWSALDTAGCEPAGAGKWSPSVDRVRTEFSSRGMDLSISHVQLFDCFRAEWRESGTPSALGAVVGQSEREAAVYALAQMRRQMVPANA